MDDYPILPGPGEFADPTDVGSEDPVSLSATPTITNTSTMEDALDGADIGGLFGESDPTSSLGASSLSNGLFTGLTNSQVGGLLGTVETAGTGLLGAFVINPQNEQTALQGYTTEADLTSALSSQYFGYILIGLVVFLIFSALDRK